MTRSRQPDVETLACAVAGGYAARWARGAARAHDADAPAPWLVDGFAGADLQRAALRGTAAHPPALAFVRAADDAFGGRARVLLVEEDPGLLARLEQELRAAGLDDRLRRASGPAEADGGDIALVEAPFASMAARLAGEIADAPALVRLAPLSARALPWGTVELLADLSGADLLLRFPGEDFARAGRFTGPLADFPPHLRRVVEGCSAFLADDRHGWLMDWRAALRAGGEEAALADAVERLRARLGNGGSERTARAARLESAGGAVHLLLTTPHPEHALELNGAVMDGGGTPPAPAKSSRTAARAKPSAAAPAVPAAAPESAPESASADAPLSAPDEVPPSESADLAPAAPAPAIPPAVPPEVPAPAPAAPAPEEVPAMLDLFAAPVAPAAPEPPRGPDLRAVADDLHARHVGRRVPFRELLGDLADAGLAPEQVRTALGMLKRERRAAYRSLDADGAAVEFHDPPAAPPAPSAPKPRKARKPVPGLLGLFDEPEDADDAGAAPEPPAPADEDVSAPSRPGSADGPAWADEPMSLADAIFPDDPPPPVDPAPSPPAKNVRRPGAE